MGETWVEPKAGTQQLFTEGRELERNRKRKKERKEEGEKRGIPQAEGGGRGGGGTPSREQHMQRHRRIRKTSRTICRVHCKMKTQVPFFTCYDEFQDGNNRVAHRMQALLQAGSWVTAQVMGPWARSGR